MIKSKLTAVALAIGMSFGTAALAETVNMEGPDKDQPNVYQRHSAEAYNQHRGELRADHRANLNECRALYGADARARCRADARMNRAAMRADMRGETYVYLYTYPWDGSIEQGVVPR